MSELDRDQPVREPVAAHEEPEPALGPVLAKLDAVLAEVRRQGRAGVAAQAAAEACLKEVHAMKGTPSPHTAAEALRRQPSASEPSASELDGRAVSLLIPLFDAIDSAVHQLRRARPSKGLGQGMWSELMRLRRRSAESSSKDSVRLGLELIQAEARSALSRLGVELDDRVGIPLDPERHRVIEVRTGENGSGAGATVLQVLRPAYLVGGVCVREADVIASRSR